MFKKSIIVTFILMFVFSTYSFAGEVDITKVIEDVEQANAKIDQQIEKTVKIVDKLDGDLQDKKISDLIEKTDKIAMKMIEKAIEDGVIVECELIEVEIDGVIYLIDPLRIVGF